MTRAVSYGQERVKLGGGKAQTHSLYISLEASFSFEYSHTIFYIFLNYLSARGFSFQQTTTTVQHRFNLQQTTEEGSVDVFVWNKAQGRIYMLTS